MIYRNYLQFESLVWKNGEAPTVAPTPDKPKEAPKSSSRPPEEQARATRRAQEEGNEAQSKDAQIADTQLAEQTAAAEKAKQEEAKKTIAGLMEKYPEAFKKHEEEANKNPEQAEKDLINAITDPTDKQKLTDAFKIVFPVEPEKKEEDSDKSSDALKGMGIGALLERLIDKLTKLFDKLSVQIDKMFGSLEKKTALFKSPLGGDKKFIITRGYEAGKGLTIAANASEEIYSVISGTVTKKDSVNKIVEITKDDGSKTVYKNIEPSAGLKTGDNVTETESGKRIVIGKAVSGDGIEFQYFDSNNTEQDPTESFKKAELVEKEPDEPKPTPTAVAAGPTAPATGAPATTPK